MQSEFSDRGPLTLPNARRNWLLAVLLGILLSTATVALAWFFFAPEFVATSLFRVGREEPKILFATVENSQQLSFEVYKRSQIELVSNRFVLVSALKSPELKSLAAAHGHEDNVAWLENHLSVDFPRDGELMRVSFLHSNAEAAAVILNSISKAYGQEVREIERRGRFDRQLKLERVFNELEEKVRVKHTDLKGLTDSDSVDAKMLRLDVSRLEKILDRVGSECESMRIELICPSRVIELQAADVPTSRDWKKWIQATSILAAAAFLSPLAVASLYRVRRRRRMAYASAPSMGPADSSHLIP